MKFLAIIAVAAAAVNAIAMPEADPEAQIKPTCNKPYQPCWKVKRAAEAFAEALAEESPVELVARDAEAQIKPTCNKPYQPCWKAKRDAEAMALALASAQDDPAGFAASLDLERRFPTEDDESLEARNAEAQKPTCNKPYQPCWKAKREAEAEAEAFCNRSDQPCGMVKRAIEAVNLIVRAPEPQIKPTCNKPYQPCWKAKRDLNKLQNVARYIMDDEN